MDTTNESGRISASIPIRIYNALEMAAEIKGESLNHFIVQAAFEKARTIIDQERIVELSQQDAERFFQAIDNPPEPSEKLVEAFRAYKVRKNTRLRLYTAA